MTTESVPVTPTLELGGTHVTAALVDPVGGRIYSARRFRRELHLHGSADDLLNRLAEAADLLEAPAGSTWGVAVPGPFDYAGGIALYEGVGKFESLYGVNIEASLAGRMRRRPGAVRFLNDAAAFAIGSWRFGVSRGHRRTVSITLGTGVGSSFLDDGVVVAAGSTVPPQGRVDLLEIDGRPLEDTVSTRSIQRQYRLVSGTSAAGVDAIAARALAGDVVATASIHEPMTALGLALAPWLDRFDATVLVVGGSVTGSWSLIEPALTQGITAYGTGVVDRLTVARCADTEASALIGAATYAVGAATA